MGVPNPAAGIRGVEFGRAHLLSNIASNGGRAFGVRLRRYNERLAGREMSLLTAEEKPFLDVFLHEATTAPFTGPATKALHSIGVEYGDISYIAWAYEQETPRIDGVVGHAADGAPSLPWPNKQSALRRNDEIRHVWKERRQRGENPPRQNRPRD